MSAMDPKRELAEVRRMVLSQAVRSARRAVERIERPTPMELAEQPVRRVEPAEQLGAYLRRLSDAFVGAFEAFARGWNGGAR